MPVPKSARRLALVALSDWLESSTDPVYTAPARIGAAAGLIGNRRMRLILAAAVRALGAKLTPHTVWGFGWEWWYQRTVDEVLAYEADRLTPEWAARQVLAPDRRPPESCVLVSIHQFNQHVAAVRAASLVNELGLVSMVEPPPQSEPDLSGSGFLLDRSDRSRILSRFHDRVFEGRVFSPRVAARRGLELLRRGGSLIVLADFYGEEHACLFGKSIPVANGPVWWAKRAGRPLVPFLLYPPNQSERHWRLWCGEQDSGHPRGAGRHARRLHPSPTVLMGVVARVACGASLEQRPRKQSGVPRFRSAPLNSAPATAASKASAFGEVTTVRTQKAKTGR